MAETNFALSETEEAIYDAVLRNGKLTLMGIARVAKLNRTTLYPYVTSLLRKDVITQTVIGKRTYYLAENPSKILRKIEDSKATFEKQLPHLLDIYKRAKHQPRITTYEGPEGIYRVFEEAYNTANYIKTFYTPGKFQEVLSMEAEGEKIFKMLKRRKIKAQGLSSNTKEGREFMKKYSGRGFEMRMIPYGMTFPVEFMIYNQRTIIVSYEHLFAVVIESADIRTFLETLFDHFWALSK